MAVIQIDFVLPWLDNTDPAWQSTYRQYASAQDGEMSVRYRDWGWLRYWLRSVEQYAPWVHRIFIVSMNPQPDWLDSNHPKIVWLHHSDFIPAEFLPTFNANTIELNLHRIKDLSEHFVYFNDDMLLNAAVEPSYYFQEGLPVDITAESLFWGARFDDHSWGTKLMEFCDVGIINLHFSRPRVVRNQWRRWYGSYLPFSYRMKAFFLSTRNHFFNFATPHHEKPLLKSVFQEVWNAEPAYLRKSCSRFRENDNVNIYLMRFWHLVTNRFFPDRCRLSGHYHVILPETIDSICKEILQGTTPSICLNDIPAMPADFYPFAKSRILEAFQQKFPEKSSFER